MAGVKGKTWVLYVEMYSDAKHKNLSGVHIEGTYSGTESGRVKSRKVAIEKIRHAAVRVGGTVRHHGEDNAFNTELRLWYEYPRPEFEGHADLHPVYVCKLVAHNPSKL